MAKKLDISLWRFLILCYILSVFYGHLWVCKMFSILGFLGWKDRSYDWISRKIRKCVWSITSLKIYIYIYIYIKKELSTAALKNHRAHARALSNLDQALAWRLCFLIVFYKFVLLKKIMFFYMYFLNNFIIYI